MQNESSAMKEQAFKFKNFSLFHHRSAHKIGTDSMLLGAWASVDSSPTNILDIGAGCGVLSFMMAQKYVNSKVVALEPDAGSYLDLEQNISNHGFQISGCYNTLQNFKSSEKWDMIITNPPYFQTHYHNPDNRKSKARHSGVGLHLKEIIDYSSRHIATDGSLFIILPANVPLDFSPFYVVKKLSVISENKVPVRNLYHLSLQPVDHPVNEKITIREKGKYTEQYIELTKDFHGVQL